MEQCTGTGRAPVVVDSPRARGISAHQLGARLLPARRRVMRRWDPRVDQCGRASARRGKPRARSEPRSPRRPSASRHALARAAEACARPLPPPHPRALGAPPPSRDGEAAEGRGGVQQDDEERDGDGGAPVQAPAMGQVRSGAQEVHGASSHPLEARPPRRGNPKSNRLRHQPVPAQNSGPP